jgi:hypothetical protein
VSNGSDSNRSAPKLDYAAPRIFFAAEHRARHWTTLAEILFYSLIVGVAATMVSLHLNWPVELKILVLLPLGMCLLGPLWRVFAFVTNRRRALRITDEGIEYDGQLRRWERIAKLYAQSNGTSRVVLCIQPAGIVSISKAFPVTPSLRAGGFREMCRELGPFLAKHHPHVVVNAEPVVPD